MLDLEYENCIEHKKCDFNQKLTNGQCIELDQCLTYQVFGRDCPSDQNPIEILEVDPLTKIIVTYDSFRTIRLFSPINLRMIY